MEDDYEFANEEQPDEKRDDLFSRIADLTGDADPRLVKIILEHLEITVRTAEHARAMVRLVDERRKRELEGQADQIQAAWRDDNRSVFKDLVRVADKGVANHLSGDCLVDFFDAASSPE